MSVLSESIVQQCGAQLPIHTLNLPDRVVRGDSFLAGGVLDCNLTLGRSEAV